MNRLFFLFSICLLMALAVSGCPGRKSDPANPAYDYVAEGRGTWIGRARGTDWDSTMAALKDAGFNMVFPNMCTGGAAFYPSEFLPMTSERDELKLCCEAARKHGIEVHVWRINWFMAGCPDSFATAMEQAGRIQYSYQGKRNAEVARDNNYTQEQDWLCPSHPENRKLEMDAMLELVRKYDVDGVHFDYMRYGWPEMCYCSNCRENFQEKTGLVADKWPEDVWEGGKYSEAYLEWRRYLITSSAREIARAVHSLDPYVCVSLAARSSVDWAYQSDAQVWWEWVREGILDFVCPMNYTTDPDRFVAVMQSHLPLVRGEVPYYSGIGVYRMEGYPPFEKNVLLGRELGQDGFVAFEIRRLRRVLEDSKAGLTSRPALLPHRAPEARFFFEPSGRETGEGFPVYSSGRPVSCKADVMFRGKIREGIAGIRGDIVLQKPGGETVGKLRTLDLKKSSVVELSVEPPGPGRYRLALCGVMALSTGSERPFIVRSFPFEVAAP